MLTQRAFLVRHPVSVFIGIVAFDSDSFSPKQAAQYLYGSVADCALLSEEELQAMHAQYSIFMGTAVRQ